MYKNNVYQTVLNSKAFLKQNHVCTDKKNCYTVMHTCVFDRSQPTLFFRMPSRLDPIHTVKAIFVLLS